MFDINVYFICSRHKTHLRSGGEKFASECCCWFNICGSYMSSSEATAYENFNLVFQASERWL